MARKKRLLGRGHRAASTGGQMYGQAVETMLQGIRGEIIALWSSARERPAILTPAAAASELSVSKTKLARMMRAGEIVPTVLGKTKMISREEIDRLMRKRDPMAKHHTGGRKRGTRMTAVRSSTGRVGAAKLRERLRRRS